jgi:hypothetical protein
MIICECGRVGVHCPQCGSISKGGLAQQTIILTAMMRDTHTGIRAYRCRACSTQYIQCCDLNGNNEELLGCVTDGEFRPGCFAPKKANIAAINRQDTEDAQAMVKAFALVEAAGFKVVPKDAEIVEPKAPIESEPELVIQKIPSGTNGSMDELPPGWSYNDKGQKVGPLSMDDLFKKKETPKDESNS